MTILAKIVDGRDLTSLSWPEASLFYQKEGIRFPPLTQEEERVLDDLFKNALFVINGSLGDLLFYSAYRRVADICTAAEKQLKSQTARAIPAELARTYFQYKMDQFFCDRQEFKGKTTNNVEDPDKKWAKALTSLIKKVAVLARALSRDTKTEQIMGLLLKLAPVRDKGIFWVGSVVRYLLFADMLKERQERQATAQKKIKACLENPSQLNSVSPQSCKTPLHFNHKDRISEHDSRSPDFKVLDFIEAMLSSSLSFFEQEQNKDLLSENEVLAFLQNLRDSLSEKTLRKSAKQLHRIAIDEKNPHRFKCDLAYLKKVMKWPDGMLQKRLLNEELYKVIASINTAVTAFFSDSSAVVSRIAQCIPCVLKLLKEVQGKSDPRAKLFHRIFGQYNANFEETARRFSEKWTDFSLQGIDFRKAVEIFYQFHLDCSREYTELLRRNEAAAEAFQEVYMNQTADLFPLFLLMHDYEHRHHHSLSARVNKLPMKFWLSFNLQELNLPSEGLPSIAGEPPSIPEATSVSELFLPRESEARSLARSESNHSSAAAIGKVELSSLSAPLPTIKPVENSGKKERSEFSEESPSREVRQLSKGQMTNLRKVLDYLTARFPHLEIVEGTRHLLFGGVAIPRHNLKVGTVMSALKQVEEKAAVRIEQGKKV